MIGGSEVSGVVEQCVRVFKQRNKTQKSMVMNGSKYWKEMRPRKRQRKPCVSDIPIKQLKVKVALDYTRRKGKA